MNNLFYYIEQLTRRYNKDEHTIGIQLMVHAIDSKHLTSLLTARGAKDNHDLFVKEINIITGRSSGSKDYFVNDDLYAKRLDWIGNNALKKLHVIVEHLLGVRFDGNRVLGVEKRKVDNAFFYDDEEKNLRILDEPLFGQYLNKVRFYFENFTEESPEKIEEFIKKIQGLKDNIKIVDINRVNDSNIDKYKKMIDSSSSTKTIHFFDIDGTLTSLKLEIDILRDGKRVFVITQEELAEAKELKKTVTELPDRKIKERESYKQQIGESDLTAVIKKALKGEDGFSLGLDEFREKSKIDRQVKNQPFVRRVTTEATVLKDDKEVLVITDEELEEAKKPANKNSKLSKEKRDIIKKAIKGWHGYSIN